ncbi:MAG TPA: hypothetical protein VFH44_07640 [Solirubrobacterales bacterium]|nr:hypothetical protein [Solirubrobacterales bacterium]
MKRLLLIAVVGSLLAAAPAAAKGLRWVELCGPDDCQRTSGRQIEFETLIFPPWVMSGAPDDPPARAGEWLRVRVAFAGGDRIPGWSVVMPGLGYAGGDQGGGYGFVWERLGRDARATYRRLGRGVERHPAATAPGLTPPVSLAATTAAAEVAADIRRTAAKLPAA